MGGIVNKVFQTGENILNSVERTASGQPARTYTPYQTVTAQQIDTSKMNEQIARYGNQQKQQNVNAFNAAVASQHGINPALTARLVGNNLANVNQQTSQQISQQQAQQNLAAQQFNAQQQMQAATLNSQNYNAAQGANMNAYENAAQRQAALAGGVIGGVSQAAGAAVMSDIRTKEDIQGTVTGGFEYSHPYLKELYNMNPHAAQIMQDEEMRYRNSKIKPSQQSSSNPPKKVTSDEKAKTKLKPADDDISDMFDHINPYYFKYKQGSPADDGGEMHAGVMAQEVEKAGPVGASMVKTDPNTGYKIIDIPNATSTLLASISEHHDKIGKIEEKIEKMMKGAKKK